MRFSRFLFLTFSLTTFGSLESSAEDGGTSAQSIIENAQKSEEGRTKDVEGMGEEKTEIGKDPDPLEKNDKGGKDSDVPTRTAEIEDFVAFVYSPGPRDPFISPMASGTIVVEKNTSEDITSESLMAFAEKLRADLGKRVRVVGVSVPPSGENSHALVIYADGMGEGAGSEGTGGASGKIVVPALPPRTITIQTGIPIRYPPDETAFISRLAQLVAQNSPLRLKRDSRTDAVIFPVTKIDEKGVQVSLPGHEEPILLPLYREVETFTGAGD